MGAVVDLLGRRFGRLLVVGRAENNKHNKACWTCLCDCGSTTAVVGDYLIKGDTASCGCLWKERVTKHGKSYSPEYEVWKNMIRRCTNPNAQDYPNYGGRGITVCEDWLKLENFCRDMGPRPTRLHSLERSDNDKGYCKENCRWATKKEQNNNRRSSRVFTYNGKTQSLQSWADALEISVSTLWSRVKNGWDISRVLTEPVSNPRK